MAIAIVVLVIAVVTSIRRSRASAPNMHRRWRIVPLLAGGGVSLVTAFVYPLLLTSQGTPLDVPVMLLFEGVIVGATILIGIAAMSEERRGRLLRYLGSALLIPAGVVSGFSIGGLLLIAAALVLVGESPRQGHRSLPRL